MNKWIVLLAVIILPSWTLMADHIAKWELSEIEWNGSIKTYNPVLKFEQKFQTESEVFTVDTIDGIILFGKFEYLPVFNDTSDRPGFIFLLYDAGNRSFDISTPTDYKAGMYDAGSKVKDQSGLRRWAGKLRYVPDTSVHMPRPYWRQDNYTLQIETFKAWNSETEIKNNAAQRMVKNLYFQGHTGEKTPIQSGGKYGSENYYILADPVRYQWGNEVWTEITIRLHRKQSDGKLVEILAHTFSSKDKGVLYNGAIKNNAYEVRDSRDKYYMLLTGVLLIPY